MKKALLALVMMVVFAVPSFSETKDMGMKEHMTDHGHMMETGNRDMTGGMIGLCLENADKIGLTDAQIKKIKPIHWEMRKTQARFNADLKIAEIELIQIMDRKDFDIEKASVTVKKISDIKTAHFLQMLQYMKEARNVLTEEQFNKINNMTMPMKIDKKGLTKKIMKK